MRAKSRANTAQHVITGGSLVPYELDESKGWGMNLDILKKAVQDARAKGKAVRGMVFINPGNPTGMSVGLMWVMMRLTTVLDLFVL